MVILRVACDNLYMFKNFELDLAYERKVNHPLATNDVLFEGSRIRARKNIIIMGANASGKTTFGKLICAILNFIRGTNLDNEEFSLSRIQYDKSKDASFEIEFVIKDTAYLLKASFRNLNLYKEKVYVQKIHKSYNIKKLREKLNSAEPETFDADEKDMNLGFKSFIFSVSKSNKFKDLNKNFGFLFMFSEPEPSWNYKVFNQEVDVEFLDKLLPKIDNSVKDVKRLQVEGEGKATNSYQISFKNGENLTVVNGDLKYCGNRLSHGTFETIDFLSCLNALKGNNLFYVDERLSHMHPELETYLARQAFFQKSQNAQLFFTTHDKEFLELNAPNTAYILFKRNRDGFNSVVCVSDKLNKNDRNLRNYYENDYFGTLPDYSVLDELFEDKESDNG